MPFAQSQQDQLNIFAIF